MLNSRFTDARITKMYKQGITPFQVTSNGHEALAAIGIELKKDDYLFPHYRDKALLLAKGMTVEEIARNALAKAESECAGRNMTGHYSCKRNNIYSLASPVASQCLPAVGIAWSLKQNAQQNAIVVCSVGDASTRQGEFFEAVCFAVEKSLPILFIVQDNKYGISTSTINQLPFRLNIFDEKHYSKLDASCPILLNDKVKNIIENIRTESSPHILWCCLDRLDSHASSDDQERYRAPEEIEQLKDPIIEMESFLLEHGIYDKSSIDTIKMESEKTINHIFKKVYEESEPASHLVNQNMYGYQTNVENHVVPFASNEINMVEAVNLSLAIALEQNPDMLLFGEDIEDPKGGVFGFTKGLSNQFGKQVQNSPLAEATIAGVGIGWASTGAKACVEIQFIDFITPALNQIFNQLATLSWRTNGHWQAPLVMYAPYGGYVSGGGIWHSQSLEALFAHMPGIKVAVPSTPEDVLSAFHDAFRSQSPSLILIPKNIMRLKKKINGFNASFFGAAKKVVAGDDITSVSWGNGVHILKNAARDLREYQIGLEIIDHKSIVPCDIETIKQSVKKTNRLLVLHEDNKTCGFGESLISTLTADPEIFKHLKSPPKLVARDDVYVPFNTHLEQFVLPSEEDVTIEIMNMLRYEK